MKFGPGGVLSQHMGAMHFIGIGGIGMSGIAEVLHNLGYKVQGSDLAESANVLRLRQLGIVVHVGHKSENIGDAVLVVKSSAVQRDNPEMVEARTRNIPIISRAEMLAELMRLKMGIAVAGTHGKTTTTSLVATILEAADLSPTVINGGIINSRGTNAYLGQGDYLVAEADESDGSFIRLPATIGIVTNIDPEHMDYYGSFSAVKQAFRSFIENIPFYGFVVLCMDHPVVAELAACIEDKRIVTYGLEGAFDYTARITKTGVDGSVFDVIIKEGRGRPGRTIQGCHLPIPGKHNVQNALSAIAVAAELGCKDEVIMYGFARFQGVKRRFTKTGEVGGVVVIDDYAHHPIEIEATLRAARSVVEGTNGRVIAVMQPHRYTRFRDLFAEFTHCFVEADHVMIADIYSAGEAPIEGMSAMVLVEAIRQAFPDKTAEYLSGPEALPGQVQAIAKAGDLVLCLGAGTITNWAAKLPEQLSQLAEA
jgi:UDP-N-acetylmuramate--alanine ligase